MITPLSSALVRIAFLGVTLATIVTIGTGCQHITGLYNATLIRAQEWHDMSRIRQDTREELAQQREEARRVAAEQEVEAARIEAERMRLETEFCMANQEALQRQVKSNIRNVLESKVAFPIEQALEVGELEVDVEALQKLIQERQQEAQRRPPEQEAQRRPCSCCDQPCGCEPGLLRRFCPHCRHKPCEAEEKCGGPEALRRLEQEAAKRPLRPAEIPMKLPVRLNFGFQQPEMEAARIRRQPNIPEALKRPCGPCADGQCPLPCTDPVPMNSETTAPIPADIIPVPVPEPLQEAQRRPRSRSRSPYDRAHFKLSSTEHARVSFLSDE